MDFFMFYKVFFVSVHNTDQCLHKRCIYLFLQINGTVCIWSCHIYFKKLIYKITDVNTITYNNNKNSSRFDCYNEHTFITMYYDKWRTTYLEKGTL